MLGNYDTILAKVKGLPPYRSDIHELSGVDGKLDIVDLIIQLALPVSDTEYAGVRCLHHHFLAFTLSLIATFSPIPGRNSPSHVEANFLRSV